MKNDTDITIVVTLVFAELEELSAHVRKNAMVMLYGKPPIRKSSCHAIYFCSICKSYWSSMALVSLDMFNRID